MLLTLLKYGALYYDTVSSFADVKRDVRTYENCPTFADLVGTGEIRNVFCVYALTKSKHYFLMRNN